jgi:hypothetical protein
LKRLLSDVRPIPVGALQKQDHGPWNSLELCTTAPTRIAANGFATKPSPRFFFQPSSCSFDKAIITPRTNRPQGLILCLRVGDLGVCGFVALHTRLPMAPGAFPEMVVTMMSINVQI